MIRYAAGRIIYVDGARGKDEKPEDGTTLETAMRTLSDAIDITERGDVIYIYHGIPPPTSFNYLLTGCDDD